MLFRFFYHLFLSLALFCSIPFYLRRIVNDSSWSSFLLRRFGYRFPKIEKGNQPLLWVHAVSLGETKAIAALVNRFAEQYPNWTIVVSSGTPTGHAEAIKQMPFAHHVAFPFDLCWIVRPILKRLRPEMVLVCETDLWYQFLSSAKGFGAKIVVVNGKISSRSVKRFQLFSGFSKKLFSLVNLFLVQNREYRERFLSLGVEEQVLQVTGNLKWDQSSPQLSDGEKKQLRDRLGISDQNRIFVIGSTHHPEEQQILSQLQNIWSVLPHITVLLVPRHPDRFEEVARMIEKQRIPYGRWSQPSVSGCRLILVDAMGVLCNCYALADLAFVGGSFTEKVGGHNVLEPAAYGVPVLFGPYMHSQPELKQMVLEKTAGKEVSIEQFSAEVIHLLSSNEGKEMGERGRELITLNRGALDRTWSALQKEFPLKEGSACL